MKQLLFLLAAFFTAPLFAGPPAVLTWRFEGDIDSVYDTVYSSLEENRFYVVFEPNIQKNLASFADKWGEDYNRNRLEGIRAMVFCNAWYANAVSNADPDMLALCPLHITLIQTDGTTRILFANPEYLARDSDALPVIRELKADVARALDTAADKIRRK